MISAGGHLLVFIEVVSGQSYFITGVSGDKTTGWIDVADHMTGGEKTARGFPGMGVSMTFSVFLGLPEEKR